DGGNQSSNGGLLLLRHAERKLGICRRIADAMVDRRDPSRIRHAVFEMVMARASRRSLAATRMPSTSTGRLARCTDGAGGHRLTTGQVRLIHKTNPFSHKRFLLAVPLR